VTNIGVETAGMRANLQFRVTRIIQNRSASRAWNLTLTITTRFVHD